MSFDNPQHIVGLFAALFVKHFVFDWLYQPAYQWQNKGTYGHLGGILHAAQHGLGTAIVFYLLGVPAVAFTLALIGWEMILHYHIDWAKMNINRKMGWKAENSNQFWQLTGLDGLLHYLTYAGMIWALVALEPLWRPL